MPTKKIKTSIIPDGVYHIYNRGNNFEKVFFQDRDYREFLESFIKYLGPITHVYTYALLPNHYHFLLKPIDQRFSRQFGSFITSYTNKVNFREGRQGNLFLRYFKRVQVTEEDYLKRLVFYIHFNPQKHNIIQNFRDYYYSSYNAFMNDKPTNIRRNEVFEWFNSKNEFIGFHNYLHDEAKIKSLIIED